MKTAYGDVEYIKLVGNHYCFPYDREDGNWIFEEHLFKEEKEKGIVSRDRAERLIAQYEARKFNWEKYGLKGRPSFVGKITHFSGRGWKVQVSEIVSEWDSSLLAEFIHVSVDLNRGHEKSGLYFNKGFVVSALGGGNRATRRLTAFMDHCPPSPDWVTQSSAGVQQMMDNRPEFGVTDFRWIPEKDLIGEIYRISSEIAQCVVFKK